MEEKAKDGLNRTRRSRSTHPEPRFERCPEEYVLHFSGEDRQRLERYLEYSRELLELKALQHLGSCSFSVGMSADGPTQTTTALPDWEHVIALLHRLRPFVLQGEATYFNNVVGILRRQIKQGHLKAVLDLIRSDYSGKRMQSLMVLSVGSIVVNSDATFMKWLNAYEYHRDDDKRREIEALEQALPTNILRAIFVSLLIDKTRAILNLRELAGLVTGKQNRLEIPAT